MFAAYSLHYVGGVGNGHISADYFAMFANHLCRLLDAERQDPPFVGIMANGTSGDVNNINFRQPRPRQQPYQQMRYVAEDVAAKVHTAMKNLKYLDHVTLDARFREPTIAWRRPTAEQLEWAKKVIADGRKSGDPNRSYAYAERVVRMPAEGSPAFDPTEPETDHQLQQALQLLRGIAAAPNPQRRAAR